MEALNAKAYTERWKTVGKIKQKELQSATPLGNWRRLNAIKRRAARLGITRGNDDGEMEIFLLWARLRMEYASS